MNRFFQIWILTLLLKLGLAALLPLSPDEAYYWIWSQYLQLSYYDHPPFVAWLFYLGHFFDFWGQMIRWPAVILGHGTLAIWYLILKNHFPWEKFRQFYILALLSPLIGFGSLVVTPDIPLVFFWSLAIYFFLQALWEQKPQDYFLLGVSLGLGFCSKYHIVLFVPLVFVYLLISGKWRQVSLLKTLWTLLGGLLFSLPVLMWNWQNDFISFRFQLHHGLGQAAHWEPEWTYGYVLAEFLLLFPWIVFCALKARITERFQVLSYLAWGPLIFFFFSSFRGAVELNWPIAAFPAVFALVLFSPKSKLATSFTGYFWGGFYILIFAAVLLLPVHNPLAKGLREPFRFRPLARLQEQYHPLYTGTYQMASTIWYENRKPIYKLRDMSRFDFFDTLPNSMPQEDTFYLIQENWSVLPDWVEKSGYKTEVVEKIEPHFIVVKVSK